MKLTKARVTKYRSVRDSEEFNLEAGKTILVGPNEAGKTAVLRALQQLSPPPGVPLFDELRDYPRSELNEKEHTAADATTVVEGWFSLEEEDRDEVDEAFADATYVFSRRMDNSFRHRFEDGPKKLTLKDIRRDLDRCAAHTDGQAKEGTADEDLPSGKLRAILTEYRRQATVSGKLRDQLLDWLRKVALPLIDEDDEKEDARHAKLLELVELEERRVESLHALSKRLPTFVYFHNYFRVRPVLHLKKLADRIDTNTLDDEQYDYGNKCLLKLLGFEARELSDLGIVQDPDPDSPEAMEAFRRSLDERDYKLNAASIRLTKAVRDAWNPDRKRGEAATLNVKADGQYLKVAVQDGLGVEVELDQRSEGLQWLVSFLIVFFAETAGQHKNAILLLDEPGTSLHGLKQVEFRRTLSALAENNQLIYTTHSPFLVGHDELDLVRVVEMPDRTVGTKVLNEPNPQGSAAMLPLQEALGYELVQSLFDQPRNLLTESLTDLWYIDATSQMVADDDPKAAVSDKIELLPTQHAAKVIYYATILHSQGLKVAALLDSDAAGDAAASQDRLVERLGNKGILRSKDVYEGEVEAVEVEELLRETLVEVANEMLDWDVANVAKAQPERPILEIFRTQIGDEFTKRKLARAYLDWTSEHTAGDLREHELAQWTELFKRINKALK